MIEWEAAIRRPLHASHASHPATWSASLLQAQTPPGESLCQCTRLLPALPPKRLERVIRFDLPKLLQPLRRAATGTGTWWETTMGRFPKRLVIEPCLKRVIDTSPPHHSLPKLYPMLLRAYLVTTFEHSVIVVRSVQNNNLQVHTPSQHRLQCQFFQISQHHTRSFELICCQKWKKKAAIFDL